MSINNRFNMSSETITKEKFAIAEYFLSTFDVDIHNLPSKKIHILDYPSGQKDSFNQLNRAFKLFGEYEGIFDIEMTSKIEDEPAARLIFLFLSNPKDLSTKVSHLTTYTSSERPIIWILVKESDHPRFKEKIPSIWEPLTNAQYFEYQPTLKIDNQKWIGTRFTIGKQGLYDIIQDKDIHTAVTLSPQARKRHSIF